MHKYIFTNDKEKFVDTEEVKENFGVTTSGKTIEGEFTTDNKTFTDKNGNVYHVNDGGEIIEE